MSHLQDDHFFLCKANHTTSNAMLLLSTRSRATYEGWNFNSGNYLFTADTK